MKARGVSTGQGPLTRRLYGLALASVAMSLLLAVIVIRVREQPPHPGMVRLALLPLGAVLDDPAARAQELDRLHNDADLELAVYSADKKLVASSVVPAPPLPDDLPRPFERGGFDFDRKGPPSSTKTAGPSTGTADLPPPPEFGSPDGVEVRRDRNRNREPSRVDRDELKRRGGPKKKLDFWVFALQWSTSSHAHLLTSSSGTEYWVVQVKRGEWPLVVGSAVGVVALLGLLSLLFAATLAKPLRELGRATTSFGQGDLNTRADLEIAGPFADLAGTFNDMADKVGSARRAERELLANVSHELRTPLARIRVALDIADEGDAHLARESLAEIGSDLAELETIIEDILTATRLESGQLTSAPPLRLSTTTLSTLLDAVASRFRSAHAKHTLVIEMAPTLPALTIDAVLIRRALDNFVDNAGKYAAPASTVKITVTLEKRDGADDVVVIAIADRGPGIAVDDQAKLFTPFFRADKSRTRTTGGVGLGLVLSRRIVEAHGGTVVLTSTVDVGTTVTIRLPV